MEKNKFTHGSLFSGIGGPEIAAEEMGWKNMFHCEINPFGRKILDYWFPNSKSYEDITKTNFTEWRGKINVLTGGFPNFVVCTLKKNTVTLLFAKAATTNYQKKKRKIIN